MREKYESLSLVVLKDLAKARGIKGLTGLKKEQIVELMLADLEVVENRIGRIGKKAAMTRDKDIQNEVNILTKAKEALEQTWSVRTLQRNISSQYYHRMLQTQQKDVVIPISRKTNWKRVYCLTYRSF